jgi:lycopene beta-cyclase
VTRPDVLVAGGGPAGRALAVACARHGLRTELADPRPDRPWLATYGAWRDELPAGIPLAASVPAVAIARTRHDLGREYAVLDTAGLRARCDAALADAGVRVTGERVTGPGRAAVLVDATGPAQALRAGAGRDREPARQCAAGVVLDEAAAAPLAPPGQAVFMDWRPVPGVPAGPPTFLYAVPLGAGRVLLEETSLAARPGVGVRELTRRLHARLAAAGVPVPAEAERELVRFPLDRPRHRTPGVLGFGAAAPLVHPATGYQLATALALADPLAGALAAGLSRGPAEALRAGHRALWPRGAGLTHRLRRQGLECLLELPPGAVPDFFEGFFRLSPAARADYLGARTDPYRTLAAMAGLFRTTGWHVRIRLIGSSLQVRRPLD